MSRRRRRRLRVSNPRCRQSYTFFTAPTATTYSSIPVPNKLNLVAASCCLCSVRVYVYCVWMERSKWINLQLETVIVKYVYSIPALRPTCPHLPALLRPGCGCVCLRIRTLAVGGPYSCVLLLLLQLCDNANLHTRRLHLLEMSSRGESGKGSRRGAAFLLVLFLLARLNVTQPRCAGWRAFPRRTLLNSKSIYMVILSLDIL